MPKLNGLVSHIVVCHVYPTGEQGSQPYKQDAVAQVSSLLI
jgi:hypothetical protein